MAGTAHMPLLHIPEISAHADGAERPLLDGVGLTVPAGTVTAVVGPSGSGKTTLGLAALGASRSGVRRPDTPCWQARTCCSWPRPDVPRPGRAGRRICRNTRKPCWIPYAGPVAR